MKKNESFLKVRLKTYGFLKIIRIMKLTTCLLFLAVLQVFAGSAYSQNTKLTFDLGETTVEQVLTEIENQSEFYFLFSQKLVDVNRKVNLKVEDIKIDEILSQVFNGTNVDYIVLDRQIVLSPGEYLEEAKMLQPRAITGTVTDENDEVLPGVNVVLKGTNVGTITDLEGNYQLEVPDATAIITFSSVGYITQEVTVGNQMELDIQMTLDLIALEEIVVIGYGVQRKMEVTGAVGSVKSEDFIQGNVSDAGQLIRGKVAGLTIVTPSGDPTSTSQILLRGTSTLKTSTQPLILVDGIPGDLNTLAQDDIASIDVLKDGSAAAIYGTRGTNGVILITSKKTRGKIEPTINYNGYVSTEQWVRVPRMLNAQEYRDRIAGGTAFADLGSSTDWVKEISNKTPISQYHNFSLTGGTNKTNYMASLNYRQSPGMIINYDYKTLNSRIDVNHKMFNDKLILNANFISNDNRRNVDFDQMGQNLADSPDNGIFNQALWRNPTAPIKNEDGTWNEEVSISYYENPPRHNRRHRDGG